MHVPTISMAWIRLRGHLLISWFNFIFVLANLSTVTHENVIFQKSNEITTTRSQWLVSFVIDLGSYKLFIVRLTNERVNAAALSQHLLLEYKKKGKPLFQTFKNLRAKFTTIKTIQENDFLEYETLKSRHKWSVLPIVGKTLSFLFGTASEEDLNFIKRSVQNLSQNQKQITHVLEENISILNVTRIQVAENRKAINELLTGLKTIDFKLENITRTLE